LLGSGQNTFIGYLSDYPLQTSFPGSSVKQATYNVVQKLGEWHVSMAAPSLTSHTLRRERKGLVMLQLLSCRRGTQLSNIVV